MKKNIITLIAFSIIIAISCKKEKAEEIPEEQPTAIDCSTISFSTDILPLFQGSCVSASCHDSGNAADGVSLSNYTEVTAVAQNRLVGSIKHQAGFDAMPRFGNKLSPTQISKIDCWISEGKKNN